MQNNNKKLTLKKMAQHLQVSTATISNAFNRPDQLSEALRHRILQTCRELGYAGPYGGRRHKAGHSGIVGVLMADNLSGVLADPGAQAFLAGLARVLDSQHYNLLLLPGYGVNGECRRLHEAMVDGFILYADVLYGDVLLSPAIDALRQTKKRMVAVDCVLEGCASVSVDNYGGARISALHALEHSPATVAILGLRLLDTTRVCRVQQQELQHVFRGIAGERLKGYLDALTERGYPLPAERIWNIPDRNEAVALQAAREALSCQPRPDLLLCMSDQIAVAAIQAAQDLGLRVPQDVRLVGYGSSGVNGVGHCEGDKAYPSLTTVEQPGEQKGQWAARMFLGEASEESIELPTALCIGESCP
ncbi:hypothetical protein A8C75_11060 [Marinobacterium aestuarii]|uniref:HTH lacI-type domain-containing protein n=1 Tax=Marinobacterium aestuarii TaxID=1821621 RepID=A0A1A9EZL5_9GAMM|nr:LacI family DNA-binding transcriptional regulator [Marinobacterium aestuarii]ANG62969.1 hypothetical protein A8C75_11060 [Marinobacterium aestuarii]